VYPRRGKKACRWIEHSSPWRRRRQAAGMTGRLPDHSTIRLILYPHAQSAASHIRM